MYDWWIYDICAVETWSVLSTDKTKPPRKKKLARGQSDNIFGCDDEDIDERLGLFKAAALHATKNWIVMN